MQWNDSSTRTTRPTYLPPHLREPTNGIFPPSPRSPRGRRGRRAPTRSRPRSERNSFDRTTSLNNPHLNAPGVDDLSGKFDELEVVEGDSNSPGNADAYENTPVETSGFDVPAPATSFADIQFPEVLSDNIRRCKFVKPTPIQRYAIPVAMAGRDLMACAQTGSGKTAAFCFPVISGILRNRLERPYDDVNRDGGFGLTVAFPLTLILSPTRELASQIYEEVKKFSYQTGVKVSVAYGGTPIGQQLRNLEKGVDILVATPGRLVDMIVRDRVSLRSVKYLILDEADRMLDMGFEPQIRKLVQHMEMPPPGVRQTLLFSATFPTEIQKLASDFLSKYIFVAAGKVGSSTDLIIQKVEYVKEGKKRKHLTDLLCAQRANENQGKLALTLIFVETKRGADALQQWLSGRNFPSTAIHGDKMQMERERALRTFKSGLTPILVATDVAARGLDIPHVAHVINFDLPRDIEDYVHRIGRTGRAGKSGLATAFFSNKNLHLSRALVDLMQEANQEIPSWLNQYAETSFNSYSSRPSRYGGSRFGGHDYRRGTSRDAESSNCSNEIADGAIPDAYAPPPYELACHASDAAGYSDSARAYPLLDGVHHHSSGSIVATGWE